jgi:hypothetical protein
MNTGSAIAFPRLLGIELSSSNVPRLHSFGWNLGVRAEPRVDRLDFTQYMSFIESQRLVEVFFAAVHPVFDFMDRESFTELWRSRYILHNEKRDVDAIICGVAALGSLFTIGSQQSSHPHEAELVNLAKIHLESTSTLSSPSEDHVTGKLQIPLS